MAKTTLKDLANTASQIITVVAPIIRFAVPGSEAAIKIADALDAAGRYLKFADSVIEDHLPEIEAGLAAIKVEVDAMAAAGDGVTLDKWADVSTGIKSANDRIRAAMGK